MLTKEQIDQRKGLTDSQVARFEQKFIPEPMSGCWLWVGAAVPDGYGSFGISTNKTIKAHRMSWLIYRGMIPEGGHILHSCDNRACVNPEHLFLGDNNSNVADRVSKGRSYRPNASGECKRGHPFSGENIFVPKDGAARCRECSRLRYKRFKEKKKCLPLNK